VPGSRHAGRGGGAGLVVRGVVVAALVALDLDAHATRVGRGGCELDRSLRTPCARLWRSITALVLDVAQAVLGERRSSWDYQ
jgi:hypothetical protein